MATYGLRDVYIAPLDIGTDGAETYGTARRLAKAIKAEMSVDVAEQALYADDSVDELVREFTKGTLTLNVNDLTPEDTAALLGQKISDNGIIFAGEADDPPYFAVAFRMKRTDGKYRYVWLYKVKFKIPSESFDTKNDSITFTTPQIEGEFIKRSKDDMWKADYTGEETDAVASSWFSAVVEYTPPSP